MSFASNYLRQKNESILAGGGGGGSATSANQTTQINQLNNLIDEQGASGAASGLSGTPTIIIPAVSKLWTNLFIQAPASLNGSTFSVEVSSTTGANWRQVGTITQDNELLFISDYFYQIRLRRLSGSATTLNWYTTNRAIGNSTAKESSLQTINFVLGNLLTTVSNIDTKVGKDFAINNTAIEFQNSTLTGLRGDINFFLTNAGAIKVTGISILKDGGNYDAILTYIP